VALLTRFGELQDDHAICSRVQERREKQVETERLTYLRLVSKTSKDEVCASIRQWRISFSWLEDRRPMVARAPAIINLM
jgi:hypothetical protein